MARLRTFIAIDVGNTIRSQAVTLQQTLSRAALDVNWVEPENMHLTLLFLGEVDNRAVLDVCRAVTARCKEQQAFTVSIEGVGCFGNPRRPRTIWIGVGEGGEEVKALHAAIEKNLLELGCYRGEDRAFTPHITLGRVKQTEDSDALAALLQKKAEWQGGAVEVREVLVMSSELTSKGPIYTVLSRAPLARPQ